jgi:hypothetical protein
MQNNEVFQVFNVLYQFWVSQEKRNSIKSMNEINQKRIYEEKIKSCFAPLFKLL